MNDKPLIEILYRLEERIKNLESSVHTLYQLRQKNQILENQRIANELKNRIEELKAIPKNVEDFLFTHYNMEIKDLERILEGKK